MTTENAATTDGAAAVAAQSAHVAPGKGTSKKGASTKEGAPKSQKSAKGGKPKAAPAPKPKKTAPASKTAKAPKTAKPKADGVREGTKTAKVVDLLKRSGGATLSQIMKATGWQPHSVRGFISGTLGKKMGLTVASVKGEDGQRCYSVKG
jgi:hypothetical protein